MTALKKLLLLTIILPNVLTIMAQPDKKQYQFRRIDMSKGLSNSQVNYIYKDSQGFIWVGTMSGLNRYDGYKFKVFKHNSSDSSSIADNYITRIVELPGGKMLVDTKNGSDIYDPVTEKFDHKPQVYFNSISLPVTAVGKSIKNTAGDYYFLQRGQGLFKYIVATNSVIRVLGKDNPDICDMTKNEQGDLWLVYSDGTIKKLSGKTGKIIFSSTVFSDYMHKELLKYTMMSDSDDELWLYVAGETRGVYNYNPVSNQLLHFSQEQGLSHLNTGLVRGILQGGPSEIWICTDHGGINVLNKKDYSIQYVLNNADDKMSLSQNSINAIYKDDMGIVWIGTYKRGLNCYHESIIKFPLYRHQASSPGSLSFDDVNRFVEDDKGNIWIGSNGGGLVYFDRKQGTFKQYKHKASNPNSLSNDVIVSLFLDSKKKLWIGTYFGGLNCFDGKTFTHFKHDPENINSLSSNNIWEIYEDKQGDFWIGTLGGGLDKFDRKKNTFQHYGTHWPQTIESDFITVITENKDGNLWIGTSFGIYFLNKRLNKFNKYLYKSGDSTSLSNNNVLSVLIDSRERLWVGTRDGLDLFNDTTKTFQHFTTKNGLPDNAVLDILEDNNHQFWISTPNGIASLEISETSGGRVAISAKSFTETDGLQATEFNDNASLKTRGGELIFGGVNGFNLFQPENIKTPSKPPHIVLTNFEVFNKTIEPREFVNGKVILDQAINDTKTVVLKSGQNDIAIEFAALDFSNPEKTIYSYKLNGLNEQWSLPDSKLRKAVFTNLDPGVYTFYVRTANNNGGWNNNAKELRIKILPPFWKTTYAYWLYFFMILAALYLGRLNIIRKTKLKFAIEQERLEAQRMHELDLMKIKFFTNVSHEFRTPLALILAPLDKMLKHPSEHQPQLQLIHRNARRLLNLVNQLLDFRKMEEKELRLQVKPGNIVRYIGDVAHFFTDVADKKSISFSFHSNIDNLYADFDHDKIERILFNLLSNAFKFTPENGHVDVEVNAERLDTGANQYKLEVSVVDTGIGIEAGKEERIFERFFQNEIPGSLVNQGSGIGLAITREFVHLHGGTVAVRSEPDKGSRFIVTLPLMAIEPSQRPEPIISHVDDFECSLEEKISAEPFVGTTTNEQLQVVKTSRTSKKPSVLLVEDNEDFRFYLKDNLKEYYNIVEASNGKQGWQKALAAHPDLVVSDISMPEMTGTALCKKIKSDSRTTHIPVILLTALAGEDQQLKGLETGASDYMTKPFNFEILLSKIKNQLTQKELFKKTYQKQVDVKPSEVALESPSERFMLQLMTLIEKKIAEPDFSVEEMSREMFISRVALYKKLLALTGKTPVEFLREIRLKRAAVLMEKSEFTVAEIAYQVGFNNPKNFSRYFKTEFGKLPSIYRDEALKKLRETSPN